MAKPVKLLAPATATTEPVWVRLLLTAIATVMLVISFALILVVNLLQKWQQRRT